MESGGIMSDKFTRIFYVTGTLDLSETHYYNRDNGLHTKAAFYQNIFEIMSSKIGTNLLLEGKPSLTVCNYEPDNDDEYFATAVVPIKPIEITFKGIPGIENYEQDRISELNPGDILGFVGIKYESIIRPDGSDAVLSQDFLLIKFAMKERTLHGDGIKKYKASITFSDTYEVEVMANNEEEARKFAANVPFYDWDHIFNVEKDLLPEYFAQPLRYSLWLPSDIKITKE